MGTRSSSSERTTAQHPNQRVTEHDLVDSDLEVGPLEVSRSDAILLAFQSQDGKSVSVTVKHHDTEGNTYQTEEPADLSLNGVVEDWARLVRKGPRVTITVSDTSGAAQNRVNLYIDTEA
jgi:hypothetical protein